MPDRLVFRIDALEGEPPPLPENSHFYVANGILSGARISIILLRSFGAASTLRTLAKVATPSRAYYCIVRNGKIATSGWVAFGFYKHQPIGSREHAIGPIFTAPDQRRLGLASHALRRAVKYCLSRGATAVYIDTTDRNMPSLRTIRGVGFVHVKTLSAD
jgi:hypothetical protein